MAELTTLLQNALDAAKREDLDTVESKTRQALVAVLHLKLQNNNIVTAQRNMAAMAWADGLIRIFPTEPEGYRWKADIFYEQQRYERAAELYHTYLTLAKADDSTQQVHARLRAIEQHFAAENQKRLLCHLPTELLLRIFELAPSARFVCMSVCWTLRQRLKAIPELWESLTLDFRSVPHLKVAHLNHSDDSVREYVKYLCLKTNTDACLELQALSQVNYSHLQRFNFIDSKAFRAGEELTMRLSDISFLGASLREFIMQSNAMPQDGFLHALLSLCPNLTYIAYQPNDYGTPLGSLNLLNENDTAGDEGQRRLERTAVQYLEWPTPDAINEIVKHPSTIFPELQCLSILFNRLLGVSGPDMDDMFRRILHGSARSLRDLILGSYDHRAAQTISTIQRHGAQGARSQQEQNGLRKLIFGHMWHVPNELIIRDIILCSKDTLEHLQLCAAVSPPALEPGSRPLSLPRLRFFCVVGIVPELFQRLPTFLQRCPALRMVQFDRITLTVEDLAALAQLPALHTVTFRYCRDDRETEENPLVRFAHEAALLGGSCPLRRIAIEDWGDLQDVLFVPEALVALGQLGTLEEISLLYAYGAEARFLQAWQAFINQATVSGLSRRLQRLETDANNGTRGTLQQAFPGAEVTTALDIDYHDRAWRP
ncbi:hypothetical protein BCR43DRAFT_489799 [Syncephalastrum racemosum]|uniref:F-box domain-containing protein n=1 Tax=Syncephalastrum racemosum TaxID=13706 RepID=A0A1X2HEW4_SYNRA|nr:hypothetical protein BCR43DRAFT_489799 [Syncephalastrum racemosum]